jgi:C4-dicarboxylate-binding protein DctP
MQAVQNHLALSNHGYQGHAVIANQRFWQQLTAEQRALLQGALRDATAFANQMAVRANDTALAEVRRAAHFRVHALAPEQRRALRRTLLPVHRQMEGRIGTDLMRRAYRVAGFDPAAPG